VNLQLVRNKGKRDFEVISISSEDVLYVCVREGHLWYRTAHEMLGQVTSIEEQERAFASEGFARCERGFIVQLDKVTGYDSEFHTVRLSGLPAGIPVSRARSTKIKSLLRLI